MAFGDMFRGQTGSGIPGLSQEAYFDIVSLLAKSKPCIIILM
jgi:hypothetical protein